MTECHVVGPKLAIREPVEVEPLRIGILRAVMVRCRAVDELGDAANNAVVVDRLVEHAALDVDHEECDVRAAIE